jgi:hypothetical protein
VLRHLSPPLRSLSKLASHEMRPLPIRKLIATLDGLFERAYVFATPDRRLRDAPRRLNANKEAPMTDAADRLRA